MFKFEFSEQMVGIIGEALAAQPFKISAPVIAEMQRQIDAQKKAEADALKPNGDGAWASAPSAN